MNGDFEDQLRLAIRSEAVDIQSDTEQVIRVGRRIVRGRRLGWGVAASAVVVAVALVVPGMLQRTLPAEPAETVLASPSPSPSGLVGTNWEVMRLDGADLVPGTSITLAFGEGTVTGFGGCNGYGSAEVDGKLTYGWYRTDGDRLSIGQVMSTWKRCADGIGEQETRYFEALKSVQRFALAGDGLKLFGVDDTPLVELKRVPVKLERTGWQVTSINGEAPVTERPPDLLFRDGRIHASTGCNGISGSFAQDGDRLTITGMAMTLMLCEDTAAMQQETAVVDALKRVLGAFTEAGRLHLVDATGTVVLEAIPDAALLLAAEKSTWRLDNSSGLWGKGERTAITLRVERDRIVGNSGCGNYTADLSHNGNSWSISSATREPVPCPSGAGLPADRFLGLLEKVTRVELVDTQLRLITPDEPLYFRRA